MKTADTNPAPAWDAGLLVNPHAVADKRERVRKMFAAIAPSYDLNNRLHSLWQDQRWRRKAVKLAGVKTEDVIIDVACGTGDLTSAFYLLLDCDEGLKHDYPLGGAATRRIGVELPYRMPS